MQPEKVDRTSRKRNKIKQEVSEGDNCGSQPTLDSWQLPGGSVLTGWSPGSMKWTSASPEAIHVSVIKRRLSSPISSCSTSSTRQHADSCTAAAGGGGGSISSPVNSCSPTSPRQHGESCIVGGRRDVNSCSTSSTRHHGDSCSGGGGRRDVSYSISSCSTSSIIHHGDSCSAGGGSISSPINSCSPFSPRQHRDCCTAGGGVSISYPGLINSSSRLGYTLLTSSPPAVSYNSEEESAKLFGSARLPLTTDTFCGSPKVSYYSSLHITNYKINTFS